MKTMTISPLQQDYVTKIEFNEFRGDVDDRFDSIDKRFESIDNKFKEIDQRFDRLEKSIDERFVEQRKLLNSDYERHTGMILEQMKHYMKAALEQVDAKLDKKLDKETFAEFVELYIDRPSRKKKS